MAVWIRVGECPPGCRVASNESCNGVTSRASRRSVPAKRSSHDSHSEYPSSVIVLQFWQFTNPLHVGYTGCLQTCPPPLVEGFVISEQRNVLIAGIGWSRLGFPWLAADDGYDFGQRDVELACYFKRGVAVAMHALDLLLSCPAGHDSAVLSLHGFRVSLRTLMDLNAPV